MAEGSEVYLSVEPYKLLAFRTFLQADIYLLTTSIYQLSYQPQFALKS